MRYSLGRVWVAAAALCLGTAVGASVPLPPSASACVAGVMAIAVRRRPGLVLVGITLLAAGAGMINSRVRLTERGPLAGLARVVPRCSVEGTVLEHIGGLGSLASLDRARCGLWEGASTGLVAIDDSVLEPGATFVAQGWIVPLDDGTFGEARRRVGAQAELHATSLRETIGPRGPQAAAAWFRAG